MSFRRKTTFPAIARNPPSWPALAIGREWDDRGAPSFLYLKSASRSAPKDY